MDNEKVYAMKFARVYPMLIAKAERKGRTRQEVDEVTCWLTGYDADGLESQIEKDVDYRTFFQEAPKMNPDRRLIKGVVCGIRVENIEEPLMQEIRYLDKLVDELARGKAMEKILRSSADKPASSKKKSSGKSASDGKKSSKKSASAGAGSKSSTRSSEANNNDAGSAKPVSVDSYIAAAPEDVQPILMQVRSTLSGALPDAEERISWSMPTYWRGHNIIHFSAMKNHLGIYPGAEAVEHFSERLDELGFKHSKGAIQFPYKKEIPLDLIREIALWCDTTGNHA